MLALAVMVATTLAFAQVPPNFRGGAPGGSGAPGFPDGQDGFPGGRQGGGGMNSERLALVERFDLDGSGFLEAEERTAAKEYLASIGWNTAQRRGGGGFGGGTAGSAEAGVTITPADVEEYPEADFYDTSVVRTIFVEFGFDDWEAEMEAFYNTDVELPATVTVDGVTYEDVGVRFRGNSSYSMVSTGNKRPLRLKFDTVTSGQNVAGVRTVKLLNGINDASNLRTVLTSEIFQDYIEVPRVNFVRVVINGESWGIYQNQQHYNKDFLDDWYGESGGVRWEVDGTPNGQGGMLYLGDDPDLYRGIYSIENRDTPASWAALINLFQVISETPLDGLVDALEPILDIDGVLKFLALDVALVNSDGFWARASDYELYLDESGKFHIINHDINETMSTSGGQFGGRNAGGGGQGSSGTQLDPLVGLSNASTPLRSRLLAVPELQKRYLEIMLDVAERWLDWDTLGPLAQQYHDLIGADMAVDTRALSTYAQFQTALNTIQSFVEARQAYLLGVLPGLIASIDEPAYEPAAPTTTLDATDATAVAEPDQAAAPELTVVVEQRYDTKEGPDGWHVTAGTGAVWSVTTGTADTVRAFAFTSLGEGFGVSKLDQCVPLEAGAGLSIALDALPATATADASGVALRVNPNFHDTLDACLGALASDSGSSRLEGGRNDDDIDFPFGAAMGGEWVSLNASTLPDLEFAAADIPEGANYLRLSIRARDRSGADEPTAVLVTNVSVEQLPAGTELVVNGDFALP